MDIEMVPGKLGYDRAIVTFSPDGRLFQVEYAREAVKKGTTSVGLTFKDGLVLLAVIYADELSEESNENKKIHQIDEHIAIASVGLVADARVLIDQARIKSQIHKLTYEEPIDVNSLAKYLADIKQIHTQYAGLRPMGVSFLIGGYNDEPSLFETDPAGSIFKWKAQAIGRGAELSRKVLKKGWNENLNQDQAITLGLKALEKGREKVTPEKIEITIITKKGVEKIEGKDKEKYLS